MKMNRSLKMLAVLIAMMMLTTACQAVTPGPVTTRNMIPEPTVETAEEKESAPAAETEEEEESEGEEATQAQESGTWMVATAELNIRTGPSTDYEVVDFINPGDEILKVGEEGNWAIVSFEGGHYYASGKYLKNRD